MTGSNSSHHLRSAGSFYYDYSEGFENQMPSSVEAETPLCPIPHRAGSISRPMVLREETQLNLDVVTHDDDLPNPTQHHAEEGI